MAIGGTEEDLSLFFKKASITIKYQGSLSTAVCNYLQQHFNYFAKNCVLSYSSPLIFDSCLLAFKLEYKMVPRFPLN